MKTLLPSPNMRLQLEAPPEYKGVGSSLSQIRRQAAEDGLSHTTARKLGVLFEQVLPSTPKLVAAYGTRASEIAHNSTLDTHKNLKHVFAEHAGIDGTSIWAAATSGKGAIAVHLLACMLARIWSGSEATSIWEELVAGRKRQLENCDHSEPLHFATIAATRVALTREQLAEWDNSARSWLRTADEVKRKQQKQLMLILNNIHVPISAGGDTYGSVLQAWLSALNLMEEVMCGTARNVETGASLLALSCWHLYPNLNVSSCEILPGLCYNITVVCGPNHGFQVFGNKMVSQNDPLVLPGGIVTIGLESSPAQRDKGPYWSLPLAYMRYYGPPQQAHRDLIADSERLSLNEFLQVSLGSFLSTWGDLDTKMVEYARFVINFAEYLRAEPRPGHDSKPWLLHDLRWTSKNVFGPLEKASRSLLSAQGLESELYKRLVLLGSRRASSLLDRSSALFGLGEHKTLLFMLNSTEDRVAYLRRIASRLAKDHILKREQVCIVYALRDDSDDPSGDDARLFRRLHESPPIRPGYIYATALSDERHNRKRNAPGDGDVVGQHARWVHDDHTSNLVHIDEHFTALLKNQQKTSGYVEAFSVETKGYMDAINVPNVPNVPRNKNFAGTTNTQPADTDELNLDEELEDFYGKFVTDEEQATKRAIVAKSGKHQPFSTFSLKMYIGLPGFCGLFMASEVYEQLESGDLTIQRTVSPDDLSWALKSDRLSREKLSKLILAESRPENWNKGLHYGIEVEDEFLQSGPLPKLSRSEPLTSKCFSSLSALAAITNVYTQLPCCKIALKASELHWQRTRHLDKYGRRAGEICRQEILALLVTMETGDANPHPDLFTSVMAMAVCDAIVMLGPLVCDPSQQKCESDLVVRGLRGNLGKPGIALLIPPSNPMVMKGQDTNWKVVNHARFDGELIDCFEKTSLHLSLTSFALPVDSQPTGERDANLRFLEAAVSVHDNGKWIGDLDLPGILDKCDRALPRKLSPCSHKDTQNPPKIFAVDNWSSLLDPPEGALVFRAHQNWLARLSAACISAQLGQRHVVILPEKEPFCWRCVEQQFPSRDLCTFIC
jgi:hypothetical protein